MSHVHYGLKVWNKQFRCHFGTQTTKQFKIDSARLAMTLIANTLFKSKNTIGFFIPFDIIHSLYLATRCRDL